MTYQEREISKNQIERAIQVLDLDEGIRIENRSNMIFINAVEVLDFLKDKTDKDCKIFSY